MNLSNSMREPASFRDSAGFVFDQNGIIYRQIHKSGLDDYQCLMDSGLYEQLVASNKLIPHEEVSVVLGSEEALRVIKPEPIAFISYPYEWAFSQLKLAALETLSIQHDALHHGMTLKDASAYNIQFRNGRPVLIDTLSLTKITPGSPWTAYRQFCQHFIAPLALMTKTDISLQRLLEVHLDGIPLDLASKLLPRSTWASPGLLMHIHLHAKSQKKYEGKKIELKKMKISLHAQEALLDSLKTCIKNLNWHPSGTAWANYYSDTNYSDYGAQAKANIIEQHLRSLRPTMVWDLGANDGRFSRLASQGGAQTIAFDMDPAAVEKGAEWVAKNRESHLLPLRMDLTTPSPTLGWSNLERKSLLDRGPVDVVMALALIHHLAIGNNVPFPEMAQFFRRIARNLIIEFVPREDSQVARLLVSRGQVPHPYHREAFERAFTEHFEIIEATTVKDSSRSIYLMKNKGIQIQ